MSENKAQPLIVTRTPSEDLVTTTGKPTIQRQTRPAALTDTPQPNSNPAEVPNLPLSGLTPHPRTGVVANVGKSYQGAVGRPPDALESIMVSQSGKADRQHAPGDPTHRAAWIIQQCQRYWTAPRKRAENYDPVHPNQPKLKPGSTRLPGCELSTREGIALLYLVENGRLADLLRSLEQLKERGAVLTNRTYLPLIQSARRINEPSLACALLVHAENTQAWITSRAYDEAISAQAEAGEIDLAEALMHKALKRSLRPAPLVIQRLSSLGSHTPEQWQAKWGVQVLQAKSNQHPESITREAAGIFVVRGDPPSQTNPHKGNRGRHFTRRK